VIRSALFQLTYYLLSVGYVMLCVLASIIPGKNVTTWMVQRYARRMVQAMRYVAGIRVTIIGQELLPSGPFILAPKHQSWGDGFCSFSAVDDLVFVTGNHLEKIPLLKGVLRKIGAIVVDNCGGGDARDDLNKGAAQAFADGKRILIYPEGHLSKPGTHHRYRLGIWALYSQHNVPVVPAATNLGHYWEQTSFRKKPGRAVVEFLEPIQPGLSKAEFMETLENRIEIQTQIWAIVASGDANYPKSQLVHFEKEQKNAG
jgi:1-acyl-sn-glycerol-3-phosphate acyltransferase